MADITWSSWCEKFHLCKWSDMGNWWLWAHELWEYELRMKCRVENLPWNCWFWRTIFLVVDFRRWWRRVVHRLANLWTGEFFFWQAAICLEQRRFSRTISNGDVKAFKLFCCKCEKSFYPKQLACVIYIYVYAPELPSSHMRLFCGTI